MASPAFKPPIVIESQGHLKGGGWALISGGPKGLLKSCIEAVEKRGGNSSRPVQMSAEEWDVGNTYSVDFENIARGTFLSIVLDVAYSAGYHIVSTTSERKEADVSSVHLILAPK